MSNETLALPELLNEVTTDEITLSDLQHFIDTFDGEPAKHIDMVVSNEDEIVDNADIVRTTTRKIPNLRFRLGDLLLEVASLVPFFSEVPDTGLKQFKLLLAIIKALRRVQALEIISIENRDAFVLLTIHRIAYERSKVTVNDVEHQLAGHLSSDSIAQSLASLDKLACITLNLDEILLNETIVVRREGQSHY